MNFLPFENITYKTSLMEDEIIKRLSDCVETQKTFRIDVFSGGAGKPYEGKINSQAFNIKRIINYRNSFLPRITGNIESDFDGIKIYVKMRLHVFVVVFLSVWCGIIGIGSITFLWHAYYNSEVNFAALIPFGMLIFVYGLTTGGFKYESNKSKRDLQEIFQAEIIKE